MTNLAKTYLDIIGRLIARCQREGRETTWIKLSEQLRPEWPEIMAATKPLCEAVWMHESKMMIELKPTPEYVI